MSSRTLTCSGLVSERKCLEGRVGAFMRAFGILQQPPGKSNLLVVTRE